MNVEGTDHSLARAAKRSRHDGAQAAGDDKAAEDFAVVEGFSLTPGMVRRLARLEQRLLLRGESLLSSFVCPVFFARFRRAFELEALTRPATDPAHFRVELYPGFWAHGAVEVLENGLRALLEKNLSETRERLVPLSAFLRRHAQRCAAELGEEGLPLLEQTADCLAAVWRFALAADFPAAAAREAAAAQVLSFAESLARWDVYAHFEFLRVPDAPDATNDLRERARDAIAAHLVRRFPWQQTAAELVARAGEMVVTEEMLQGMRSPTAPAAVAQARPTPPRVRAALRTMR